MGLQALRQPPAERRYCASVDARVDTGAVSEEFLGAATAEPAAAPEPARTAWRAMVRPRTVLALLALGFAVHLLLPQ